MQNWDELMQNSILCSCVECFPNLDRSTTLFIRNRGRLETSHRTHLVVETLYARGVTIGPGRYSRQEDNHLGEKGWIVGM